MDKAWNVAVLGATGLVGEETLKELQKGLQDCREKLARLEGAQPATPGVRPAGGKQ